VQSLRNAGAIQVHMMVSCPPTRYPCYYGIDFPSSEELIASRYQAAVDRIADYLGLDSLYYLSLEGMVKATGMTKDDYCLACFNADYPVEPDLSFHKNSLDGCS
jgi:amidophosphoribosyltransferase